MKKIISILLSIVITLSAFFGMAFSVNGASADELYADSLRKAGFTEQYISPIVELHKKYPNWVFKPYITGLTWQQAVDGERSPHSKQRIMVGEASEESGFYCKCSSCYVNGQYVWADSSYAASEKAVKYYMNPLNWLNERYIWQFESTKKSDSNQTQSGVEAILKGTWMYNSLITYYDTEGVSRTYDSSTKYSKAVMDAANNSGLSPYYIASKIKQEVGGYGVASKAGGSNGTTAPFYGMYNYFNWGANAGAKDGLAWAAGFMKVLDGYYPYLYRNFDSSIGTGINPIKTLNSSVRMVYIGSYGDCYKVRLYEEQGANKYSTNGEVGYVGKGAIRTQYFTYGRPWTNPYKAIYYGALVVSNNYGDQFTGYLQKYNVTPNNTFSHEYMVNAPSAASEASIMYSAYSNASLLSSQHTFYIPVYKNLYDGHTHKYEVASSNPATCTADGLTTYKCTLCDYTYTEKTTAYGHKAVTDHAIEPTCISKGFTEGSHCLRCGEVFTAQSEIDKLANGHQFEKTTTDNNCTDDGYITYKCTNCGYEIVEKPSKKQYVLVDGKYTDIDNVSDDKKYSVLVDNKNYPQSPHEYGNNQSYEYSFSYEGATSLELKLDSRCKTEKDYDIVTFYDKNGKEVASYSGDDFAGKTVKIDGDSVKITFTTDRSKTFFGFAFESIYANISKDVALPTSNVLIEDKQYPQSPHEYENNASYEYDFSYQNAKSLTFKFDSNCKSEQDYDVVTFYDKNGKAIASYSGDDFAGKTVKIDGDSVRITFTTDHSKSFYGFGFSSIYAEMEQKTILVDKANYPESSHDYANNSKTNYSFSYPGATSLSVKFSSLCKTEENYDVIHIFDSKGNRIAQYSGTELAGKTISFIGDSFSIALTSDHSQVFYGFAIESIYANVTSLHSELKATGHFLPDASVIENDHTSCILNATYDEVSYCKVCGAEIKRDVIDVAPTHHNFVEKIIEPTCDKDGYIKYECINCGYSLDQYPNNIEIYTVDSAKYPQSPHIYDNNQEYTYKFELPGAEKMELTFSSLCQTEKDYDIVYIYDKNGKQLGAYSGDDFGGKKLEVVGDSFSIKFVTDRSKTFYGFSFEKIVGYMLTNQDVETHRVLLDSSLYPQSPHEYGVNQEYIYAFSYPGATRLEMTFSSLCKTEADYDIVYVYDKNGNKIGEYSGDNFAGKKIIIDDDSFSIKFVTDRSKVFYGFSFASIYAQVDNRHLDLKATGHNYVFANEESNNLHYSCSECDNTIEYSASKVFSLWKSEYINTKPTEELQGGTSIFDLVPDGIINAKDYAKLIQLCK